MRDHNTTILERGSSKDIDLTAIILAGPRDFGRCPLASRFPVALWPIAGKPALERLLHHLSSEGIKRAVIYSSGDAELLRDSICNFDSMELEFIDEQFPIGTGGCIRQAANCSTNSVFLVFSAATALPPSIDSMMEAHRSGRSPLTVMFESNREDIDSRGHPLGIYVCEPSAFEHIPKQGYCDIKEDMILAMLRAGTAAHFAILNEPVSSFCNWSGYLSAIAGYLGNSAMVNREFPRTKWSGSKDIWMAKNAKIHPTARVFGPVIVMDEAIISEGTVIFGPTIIEHNVCIERNTLIESSVFWRGSKVGASCQVRNSIVDYDAYISPESIIESQAITKAKSAKIEICK